LRTNPIRVPYRLPEPFFTGRCGSAIQDVLRVSITYRLTVSDLFSIPPFPLHIATIPFVYLLHCYTTLFIDYLLFISYLPFWYLVYSIIYTVMGGVYLHYPVTLLPSVLQ